MPIEAITGLPGASKTALLVERLMEEGKKKEPRPLWAGGIDGLKPGLASVLADPRQWNAVRQGERCTCSDTEDESTCTAHVIPNGSLIFIDEAWKWFGHLHDAARQATPGHVLGLAEHRHRGIDFVWTFQMPAQIFPFARGMIADHTHVVRRFGTQIIELFKWSELNEDVKSAAKRNLAIRKTRTIPKASFGAYKSAEEHTIKPRIPWRVFALPVIIVAILAAGVVAVRTMRPAAVTAKLEGKTSSASLDAPTGTRSDSATSVDAKPLTPYEYAQRLLPRFPSMPETAPIYDKREVTSAPEVYCMSSEAGRDALGQWKQADVICLTEQGTVYTMPDGDARRVARYGRPYNAFRPQRDGQRVESAAPLLGGAGAAPAVMASSDAAPVRGGGSPAVQVASYGSIGATP